MRHSRKSFRFGRLLRTVGPLAMMAVVGGMTAGCKDRSWSGGDFTFNGHEGVPLAELDMSGDAPSEVVLVGPDTVVISEGEDFAISLQGEEEAKERVRFVLADGALAVLRDKMDWSGTSGATVNVTMPAPRKLTIAGSGEMATSALADDAEVVIAGSGQLSVLDADVDTLEVTIAGSGRFSAGGTARELDLNVAGSGTADMAGLMVDSADLDIAGSGTAIFASDGDVDASIMGSGNVTVRGSARCTVNAVGSGTLTCEPREGSGEEGSEEG